MSEHKNKSELIEKAEEKAARLVKRLKELSIKLCLAESCTAGAVSGLLAGVPGSSGVLWGGFVCYTQEAKVSMLGLDKDELDAEGLVSEKTARSMAVNALKKSGENSPGAADIAASVTGLAGPSGDGSDVPVGTVWVAAASRGGVTAKEFHFTGSRDEVRLLAAIEVMEIIGERLTKL